MTELERILEGALLAAGRPLSLQQLADLFEEHERPELDALREALEAIRLASQERGFELVEVASGYRFQVVQSVAPWVGKLWEEKPQKYSRALLETLVLIAYRQPITRGDIEDIRGVAVSTSIIKTLLEREWIRVVGHKDVPGRPAMYATTRRFLDYFNLKNLDQLPTLAEIRDLETMNQELALESIHAVDSAPAADASGTAEGAAERAVEADQDVADGDDSAPTAVQPELDADSDDQAADDERDDGAYAHTAVPPVPLALESDDEVLSYSDDVADESVNG